MWLVLSRRNHQIQFKLPDNPFIGTDFPKDGLVSELHEQISPKLAPLLPKGVWKDPIFQWY